MNIAFTPVSLRFRNVKFFGPQPVTMDLSKPARMMIADPGVYGFSAVTEILSVFLNRKKILPSHFDMTRQPLQIALVFRTGGSEYLIEKIFSCDKDDVSVQTFLYEWKSVSDCYVPAGDPGAAVMGGMSIAECISRTFIFWDRGDYKKEISREQPIRDTITLTQLTERMSHIRTELRNTGGNSGTADGNTAAQASEPGNRTMADPEETIVPLQQITEWVIRYVANRNEDFTPEPKTSTVSDLSDSAGEAALRELTRLFREAVAAEEKRRQFDDLNAGMEQLERVIAKMEDELKTELHTVTIQMNEKRPWALKVSEYEKELELHHRELVRLQKTQEKQKHILEQGLQDKIRLEFLERWIEEHKLYVDEKRAETDRIRRSACPACEQPVGVDQQAQLKKMIQEKIDAYNEKIFRYQIDVDEIRHAMTKLRETYADLDKEIKQQPAVWHQYYITEHRLQIARQYEKEYQALKEQSERLKITLQNRSFARREQQAIDDMRKQIQANGYQPSQLRAVYRKISDYLNQPPDGVESKYDNRGMIPEPIERTDFKNQSAAFSIFLPPDMSADNLLKSRDYDELIDNAVKIITAVRLQAACKSTRRTGLMQRNQKTNQQPFTDVRKEIFLALEKFSEELDAISSARHELGPGPLEKVTGTFRYSVACALMNWLTGEAYGTWGYREDTGGLYSLSVKRGGDLILPEKFSDDVQACAGLCMRIAGSLAGVDEDCDPGAVLFVEIPFLLHESDFINKIRTLFDELMFWMNRIFIIIPFSPDPAGDGMDYQLQYGSGGITVTTPGFPKA